MQPERRSKSPDVNDLHRANALADVDGDELIPLPDVPPPTDDDAPTSPPPVRSPPVLTVVPRQVQRGPVQIITNERPRREVIADAWTELLRANREETTLFVSNGALSTIGQVKMKMPGQKTSVTITAIRQLDDAMLRGRLLAGIDWMKKVAKKNTAIEQINPTHNPNGSISPTPTGVYMVHDSIPTDVSPEMLADPHPDLPVVERIVYAPSYDVDGNLISTPGYCEAEQLWYEGQPMKLRKMSVQQARALLQDWLVDFPFDDGDGDGTAGRAHAIAFFLLPFVRSMITGTTPLHVFSAPSPNTGKSMLTRGLVIGATGREPGLQGLTKDDDAEAEKAITTNLLRGVPVIVLDDIGHAVTSPAINRALTAPVWSARLLGGNKGVDIVVRASWAMTMNVPTLSRDLVTRSIPIRIARFEPWDPSTQARHPHFIEWTHEHHEALVSAAIALVENWKRLGRPKPTRTLGRFLGWSHVIGGILEAAGIPGFLEKRHLFETNADPVSADWEALVKAWLGATDNGSPMSAFATPRQLLTLADDLGLLGSVTSRSSGDHGRAIVFGAALRAKVDNVFHGHVIKPKKSGVSGYMLVPLRLSTPPQSPGRP